jgi:dolichol-phosphate mannosyltransferase
MVDTSEVCVLIPTLNEAETIGGVVDGFREQAFEEILVVDGHSTDDTVAIAREHSARVIIQEGAGKGNAVRQGLEATEQPYVLLVDGDGTYRPADADRMTARLGDGATEHVIGNRFADLRPGAMTRLNEVGNRLINRVFALIHGRNLQDILSGYRAFSRSSIEEMRLTAEGFGIETQMAVECVRNQVPTAVVDITYKPRPDQSTTNLRPFLDGGVILSTLYRLAKTTNPLFYFGSLGAVSGVLALLVGVFVVYDWVVNGIPHLVLAMVSVFGLLFAFQLLTFGVLTDMIVRLRR